MNCAFCQSRDDPLLVDRHPDGVILVDQAPICFGHLLVVAPLHSASVADLSHDERQRFRARIRVAQDIVRSITGRETLALEHGRSPTCADPSGACHTHVHVLPYGEVDLQALAACDFLTEEPILNAQDYIAVARETAHERRFRLTRPVPHAARTLAGILANTNDFAWNPLGAAVDKRTAGETLSLASEYASARDALRAPRHSDAGLRDSTFFVFGPTGSGKSTIARCIADAHEVPAVELGVTLRLACLSTGARDERQLSSRLWRWFRKQRLDFEGVTTSDLTAAVPRLDGRARELPLWTDLEASRLSEFARAEAVQEVLLEIALATIRRSGGVIVGRAPARIADHEMYALRVDASPLQRVRRKRAQLLKSGINPAQHDWFSPHAFSDLPASQTASVVDTTHAPEHAVRTKVRAWLSTKDGSRRRVTNS